MGTMLTQSDLRRWHFKLSEAIRKTDSIFEDMKSMHYAYNEGFVGRYKYIKGSIFDRRCARSQIIPSFDSITDQLRKKPQFVQQTSPPSRYQLCTVEEVEDDSKTDLRDV